MTLQQIFYAITISDFGSMNKAAEALYISQPTLTNAVKELEKEVGITIFQRTGKGVIPTAEGKEFLVYARQLYQQYELLEGKYSDSANIKRKFGVSSQHYSFAVKAFVETVKKFDTLNYECAMRECKTIDLINDVISLKSEIGNFSQRVTVETNDEIGQLASSFNFMADSIEKLEESHSSFCSDVSHELRTPMTSISGFVEGILDGTIPAEKQDYYLRIVLDETKRLTKFVNDTLEMSKMSSSEYQLDITEFDINELIRTCIISLGNRIDEKNLDLNVDFKQDIFKVLADKDSIKRVVLNIMDNAIKFSYPNTTMGVSTWAEKGKIYVCIGNFGDGIDSSDLSNIFNRYYKTDKSRTNEKTGAGLGLSLVKNILVLHKQAIWVESVDTKEGSNAKYTKFTFTLEKA